MRAKKLNTKVRQDQIVRAALGVVAAVGLKRLSLSRIAKFVGIVPSAIYRHFKGKDEVLDAALTLIRSGLMDNVKAVCRETPEALERLRRLLLRQARMIGANAAIPLVVFSDDVYAGHPARKTRWRDIIQGYLAEVEKLIRQGQRQGRIRRGIEPATASLMFLGLIQPAVILRHVRGGNLDLPAHAEKAWAIFSEAIRV